jgi:aminoglycoside phosphotransferase
MPESNKTIRKIVDRLRNFRSDRAIWLINIVWQVVSKFRKPPSGTSAGSVKAEPNPIPVADHPLVGKTTISWTFKQPRIVEVRYGAPDGALFRRAYRSGYATTGKWVLDGMVFYLQDISGGKQLTSENTLATVTVNLATQNPCFEKKLIAEVIERQLGKRPEKIDIVAASLKAMVYQISFPDEQVFLKVDLHKGGINVAMEGWTLERIRGLGVPVPQIIAMDTSEEIFPAAYLILARVAGQMLYKLAPNYPQVLLQQIGQHLSLIHTVETEGYGGINESLYLEEGCIKGQHETWREALLPFCYEDLTYLERYNLTDKKSVDKACHIIERCPDLLGKCRTGRLLHGDINSSHIFADFCDKKVTGIIDFGAIVVGDPLWELAHFRIWWGEDAFGHLLEGYKPDASLLYDLSIKIVFYQMIQYINLMKCFHEKEMPEMGKKFQKDFNFSLKSLNKKL